jgi:TetR/AcrR family transcriptional repressor of nem operon
VNEGSIRIVGTPRDTAASLYHLWLGASIMAKILRSREPFETVLQSTRRMLGIAQQ